MADSSSLNKTEAEKRPAISAIASFFTSVRTTIAILCCLAVTSIVGTLIPQNVNLEQLQGSVSPFYYRLTVILDLHNVYRSWWFTLLLVLLTANLVGCLVQRLRKIPREWRETAGKSSLSFTRFDTRPLNEIRDLLTRSLSGLMHGSPQIIDRDGEIKLVWVRQRVFLLGFPLIHAAIIIILVGGLVGLIYGFKGNILLKEGEVGREFVLSPSGKVATLPFDIAIDSFTLTRYPSGQPKEYRSDVVVLKNGGEMLKGPIRVNQPLTFEGISLYQANYRLLGVKQVRLDVVESSGKQTELVIQPSETVSLPQDRYRIRLVGLDPGATRRGPGVGLEVEEPGSPMRQVKVYRNDKEPVELGTVKIRFKGYDPLYATGLQIGYDPGSGVVWVGCGLLIAGFLLTLFTNLSALSVRLTAEEKGTKIHVSGRCRRDRAQFRERVQAATSTALEQREKQGA